MEQANYEGSQSGEIIFSKNTEFNRFGLISAIILAIGCTGGLAVGLGAVGYIGALIAVIIPTMTTLSLLLAVAPIRYVMWSGAISLSVNVILMTYFLIA